MYLKLEQFIKVTSEFIEKDMSLAEELFELNQEDTKK
mgnify:CR=1 FL=1